MTVTPADMVNGCAYRVRYKSETQRVDREMLALYLGKDPRGGMAFSGRPEFGTTTLPLEWFISAEPAARSDKYYVDRKVR